MVALKCWEDLGGREGDRERRWGERDGVGGSGEVGYRCYTSKVVGICGTVMLGLFCEEESGGWGMVPTRKDGGEYLSGLL